MEKQMKKEGINKIKIKHDYNETNAKTSAPSCWMMGIFFLGLKRKAHHPREATFVHKNNNAYVGAGLVSAQRNQNKLQGACIARPQNAITLISLIVTIIILLILAGVTINLTMGENGLFGIAEKAGESYKIAEIREKIETNIIDLDVEKIAKGEKLTVEEALKKIKEKGTFEEIDLNENTGIIGEYIITLGYNEKGKVIIINIEKNTGTRIIVKTIPEGYTKENVEIEISIKTSGINITNIEIPAEMVKKENGKYEVTKNGIYLVKITLENGQILEKEIRIEKIDKLAPKQFTIAVENIEGGIIVNGETTDEEATNENASSGIDRYEYIVKTENGEEITYKKNEIKLEPGKYQIYAIAYDKAGNSTKKDNGISCKVNNKYQIYNEQDLKNIKLDLEGNYYVMNDIDVSSSWVTIDDEFKGNIEGNNYTINFNNDNNNRILNKLTGNIKNLEIKGKINNTSIICYNYGVIENISLNVNIWRSNKYSDWNNTAGLAQYNYGQIKKCDVLVRFTINDPYKSYQGRVEGLASTVWSNYGTIEQCKCSVSASFQLNSQQYGYAGYEMGGICANNSGKIINCYSTGTLTGNYHLGGISYYNTGEIINCYSRCRVTAYGGGSGAECITYRGDDKTTNCYWCEDYLGEQNRAYGKNIGKKTIEELKDINTYEGWNFKDVWVMNEFPELVGIGVTKEE